MSIENREPDGNRKAVVLFWIITASTLVIGLGLEGRL